jgi:hypothetical protein
MTQVIIAFIVIAFFLSALLWQKRQQKIGNGEFTFWLTFWLGTMLLVVGLKPLDRLVSWLGFSASAIQVFLYLGVAVLFYFIFRLSLKLEKTEENLTKIVEELAKRDEQASVKH